MAIPRRAQWIWVVVAGVVVVLVLYAYRQLPSRPFAADDYQWLLNVNTLDFAGLSRAALGSGAQSHFFRPLVWLLFWSEHRLFGLDPAGYHLVSVALHLLNAALLALLFLALLRLAAPRTPFQPLALVLAILAFAVVALHPAPFEAVVWVSAQSELLAATLILLTLLLWLAPRLLPSASPLVAWFCVAAATVTLTLALLTKESSVIVLGLLVLLGPPLASGASSGRRAAAWLCYLPPLLATALYLWYQLRVERQNYLVAAGEYGIGPQLLLNPLRSLGLLVAPLPGSEHADAAWLPWVGAVAALLLLALVVVLVVRQRAQAEPGRRALLWPLLLLAGLGLTLLPTAPFVSPPDSRYLYLPLLALVLAIAALIGRGWMRGRSFAGIALALLLALALGWWATGELTAREERFAAATGPGGSLWRTATAACAESVPRRVLVVEPPIAPPHVTAIVTLACGPKVTTMIVGRDQVAEKLRSATIVIAFPQGSAVVETRPEG